MSNEIIKKTNSEVSLSEEQATEVVKKKRKGNNPQLNFGQEYVQPGDNARYLRHALATYNLPPIDGGDKVLSPLNMAAVSGGESNATANN